MEDTPRPIGEDLPLPEAPTELPEPLIEGSELQIADTPEEAAPNRLGALVSPLIEKISKLSPVEEETAEPAQKKAARSTTERKPKARAKTEFAGELTIDHSDEQSNEETKAQPEAGNPEVKRHLREVVDAALEGKPIEADFEERHEVVGERQPQLAPSVASVKEIVEEMRRQTAATHAAFSKPASTGAAKPALALPLIGSLAPLYQRAVLGGFGLGVAVVLTLMVTYILR